MARQAARVLTQLYDSRLREAGIEAPQFGLLTTLESHGACSQIDLGRRYAFDKTTVSRNLKLLQQKGWIESRLSSDKRERQFILTEAGSEMMKAAKPRWKRVQDELRKAVTEQQWEAMFDVLSTITKAAQTLC